MPSKPSTTTIPEERVLCADCGQPIRYRRVIVVDCPVTPEGGLEYQHEYENLDTEQEYGLICDGCGCFITNRYGYNADYDEVPALVQEGRLNLVKPAKKKPLKK